MAVRFPSRPTLIALCCSMSIGAYAADDAVDLGTVSVTAQETDQAPALPPEFAGGQVARGGQLGLLGSQDSMDVPFTMTSYTCGFNRWMQRTGQTFGLAFHSLVSCAAVD